jgi:hypothetical protein
MTASLILFPLLLTVIGGVLHPIGNALEKDSLCIPGLLLFGIGFSLTVKRLMQYGVIPHTVWFNLLYAAIFVLAVHILDANDPLGIIYNLSLK